MTHHTDKQPQTDASLEQQAWVWLRLLHSGSARQWDLDGFQRWVRTSSAHQQAFTSARRRWGDVGEAAALTPPDTRRAPANPGRRRALRFAAGGVTALVAGAVVMHPRLGLWPAAQQLLADGDATAVGEQRALTLAGGVNVTLNTQTHIRRGPAGIELIGGEAAIDFSGQPEAFSVTAGGGSSTSSSGSFEVRYLDDKVCVSCLAGTVTVSHPAGERMLAARQQTVYDARRISGIGSLDPEQVSAWRRGELRFDKTPLYQVIAEINRYRAGNVMLLKDAVREAPVSGSFYIASLDQALAQLQRTFQLKGQVLPAGLYLLS